MEAKGNISPNLTAGSARQYQPYLEAEWGFKNSWYPALFSSELEENQIKGVTILGREIALRRARGQVYALDDRFPQAAIAVLLPPICPNAETITCWYQGYN